MRPSFPEGYLPDRDKCYRKERERFKVGRIYMMKSDGFPIRPVKILEIRETWMLVETIPLPAFFCDENGKTLMSKPFKFGCNPSELREDVTDTLPELFKKYEQTGGEWVDVCYRANKTRNYFRSISTDFE